MRTNLLRGKNNNIAIPSIISALFVAGCATTPRAATKSAQATTSPTSYDYVPLETALEPDYPPIGERAYVWRRDDSSNIYELVSKYRGKLYVVTAHVYTVEITGSAAMESVGPRQDRVYLLLARGESVPNHPGHRLLINYFDFQLPDFKFDPGREFRIAYSESGQLMALWPASFTVVPGMFNPRDDDPNDPRPPQPPQFQLVYVNSK